MSNVSDNQSSHSEPEHDNGEPARKRRRYRDHERQNTPRNVPAQATQSQQPPLNFPPFRPPFPSYSPFGLPQSAPPWPLYHFSYPPAPPQAWLPPYPSYNAEPSGSVYSGPIGPAISGPSGPAISGPSGPAISGPSGPAYQGPPGPAYDMSQSARQASGSYHDQSSQRGNPGYLPLSSKSHRHKLSTRSNQKQCVATDSDSDDSEQESSDEEEGTEDFDPDSYYTSSTSQFPKVVTEYIETRFRKCIPQEQRKRMLKENPVPNTPAAKVPQADDDIVAFLGQEFPLKADKRLMRIQATVLSVSAPLATLWANLVDQNLTNDGGALIPADDVKDTIQRSLALLGNSVNYISQARRDLIISKLESKKKGLARIMRKACKADLADAKTELFGPTFRKVLKEKADTMTAFGKIADRVEQSSGRGHRFFRGGPSTNKYGSGRGKNPSPYNTAGADNSRFTPQNYQAKHTRYFNQQNRQQVNKPRFQNRPKGRQ